MDPKFGLQKEKQEAKGETAEINFLRNAAVYTTKAK
jgi:hypothetical protein